MFAVRAIKAVIVYSKFQKFMVNRANFTEDLTIFSKIGTVHHKFTVLAVPYVFFYQKQSNADA